MKKKTLRWLAAMLLLVAAMVIPARGNAVTLTYLDGSSGFTNETAGNLFDGKTDTKWCYYPPSALSPAYVVFRASAPCCLYGYTITTADDNANNAGRNPKDWIIYGSNDQKTWTKLVSVSNDDKLEDVNYTAYEYTNVGIATQYEYYKWEITANKGNNDAFQVSEFSISAVDWSTIAWAGDGAQGGALNTKYKVATPNGGTFVNIQQPDGVLEAGFYIYFPDDAFGEIRINGVKTDKYAREGTGVWLYVSNFTAEVTEVQVMTQDNSAPRWTLYVYYADGDGASTIKPEMVSAVVDEESITENSVRIGVSAENALAYDLKITHGNEVTIQENVAATAGYIELTGLIALTEYTIQIWAKNGKNQSVKSVSVSFTTLGEVVDLYLAGTMNEWAAAHTDYRFRKTAVDGIYALTTHLDAGAWVYKLTKGSFAKDQCTVDDHHLVLSEPKDVTFYARSVTNFASSADSIFLIGTALKDQEWTVPTHAQYCSWNGTQAVWSGEVNTSGEYKIIKIAYLTGPKPFAYWNDLWEEKQSLNDVSKTTQAVFTFDLPTLTWSWQYVHDGQCTYHGVAGDGWTGTSGSVFTTGYTLSLWLNAAKDAVVVRAEFLDTDKTATVAYMQNYSHSNDDLLNQIALNKEGNTQVFSNEILLTSFSNNEGKVIRFRVKFEFDGGLRITTHEYFYLDGSGCEDFTIYHHDDLPAEPEDGAVTTFDGGRILQPIQYKRKFKPGVWETLCVPFEVDSITVTDNEGTYHLYAQYDDDNNPNTPSVSGHFWLREFQESSVCAEDFQGNWYDIQAANEQAALPKKNQPYIMRVPEGDYYADKYITFHGKGYQTIDANYSAPALPAEGQFSYSGNNTMRSWDLQSAYVLDVIGEYFSSDQPVTLQPFECAVNATQQTIQRMPRLSISPRQVATAQQLPVTENVSGNIYTMMGVLVGHFQSIDQQEDILRNLPNGLYILQSGMETTKIFIR